MSYTLTQGEINQIQSYKTAGDYHSRRRRQRHFIRHVLSTRLEQTAFKMGDGGFRQAAILGEFNLFQAEEAPCGPALFFGDHGLTPASLFMTSEKL